MTAIPVCTDPPGSQGWLDARAHGIGGSDIATLLGHNPYATALDLWLDKTGRGNGFNGNYATARGHHLEPFLLTVYRQEHPGTIIETAPDDIPSVVAHPDVTATRVSLDALAHTEAESLVVEVKTAGARAARAWDDGALPDAYACQVAYQLAVTGLDCAHVVADLAGEYAERIVHADPGFTQRVLQLVDDWWWTHCDPKGPRQTPEIDAVRDRDVLARVWTPDVTLEPVTVPADLARRMRDARATLNAAKTEWEVTAAEVQALMADSVAAVDEDGQRLATWNPTKGARRVDQAALKAAGLFERYSMQSGPGRTFRPYL